MKIVIVDNYDSFTFNLKHYFDLYCSDVVVIRNDDDSIWQVLNACDKIVLSPGTGIPSETKNLLKIINLYESTKPILGVCLGHQALASYFGETLINLSSVMHGVSTKLNVLIDDPLFLGLPKSFNVALYHSWSVKFPLKKNSVIDVIASDNNKKPLAIRHKTKNIKGIQFHPESILTDFGKTIIKNWVEKC